MMINNSLARPYAEFFRARLAKATDEQKELLVLLSQLANGGSEVRIREIIEESQQRLEKPYSPSEVCHMLRTLSNAGILYRNRRGQYSFMVPRMGRFLLRQARASDAKAV
jgi:DNA-binding IclR family transcriptional regulator